MTKPELTSLDNHQLESITGGAARASGGGDDKQLQLMLTQITDSIKSVATQKQGPMDQMMPMMMMMMMMGGGGGGGGGGAVAAAPAPSSGTYVKVNVR
jgi:hypothetical protein